MAKLVDLTCTWCTKNYTLTNPRYQTKVKKGVKNFYCSRECSVASQRSHIKNNSSCTVCAKMFHRTKSEISKSKSQNIFCSSSCAAKFNNKGLQRNPPKTKTCSLCLQTFTKNKIKIRSKYCEACCTKPKPKPKFRNNEFNILKDKDIKLKITTQKRNNPTIKECLEHISIIGKHPSWKSSYVRAHNNSINKDLKKLPCQKCGYSKHIELCHIKAVSSFGEEAYINDINSPDNILVLCRNCHWEFDHKLLALVDIPAR